MIDEKLKYFLLILIAIATSLQFDYVFEIYFLAPFSAVLLSFFLILIAGKLNQKTVVLSGFFFVFIIFIVFFDYYQSSLSIRRTVIYYGFLIVSVATINELLIGIDKTKILKIAKILSVFTTLALLTETYFRLKYPVLDLNGDVHSYVDMVSNVNFSIREFIEKKYYYAYKYSSIMFFDSNYTALLSLFVFVLILFYKKNSPKDRLASFLLIINFLIVIFTFSRSAIIAISLIIYFNFLYFLYHKYRVAFYPVFLFSIFSLLFSSVYVFDLIIKDGSFITKLKILESLSEVFEKDLSNILFGYGVEYGSYVYSYKEGAFAHALLPLLIGQVGVVGMLFYLLVILYLSFKAGFYGWLVCFIVFFSGISLIDLFQILMFFSLLIFSAYRRKTNIIFSQI